MRQRIVGFFQLSHLVPLLLLVIVINAMASSVYRWVDKDGKVHYSHTVPIEASQGGHSEINNQGAVVNQVESRHVREKRLEEKRLEALKYERAKEHRNDSLLESVYSNKDDLQAHFNAQIKMISTNIRLLEYNRKQVWGKIQRLKKEHSEIRQSDQRKTLRKALGIAQKNLDDHDQAIKENRIEQRALDGRMKRVVGKMSTQNESIRYQSPASSQPSSQPCKCTCE